MEEEVNQRVVSMTVSTGRMTAGILARTLSNFLAREHQALNQRAAARKNLKEQESYHGKMTMKELMDQNAGAESVEINKNNIKAFDKIARKYNVDYALYKDATENPPKYLIFFKARDRDTMTMAFKEFVNQNNKKQEKKSMKQKLKEYKELSKEINKKRAKDRHRSRERSL